MVTIGAYLFGIRGNKLIEEPECGITSAQLDISVRQSIVDAFANVVSVQSCYANLPGIMKLVDLNNNDVLDRCEDALLLEISGQSVSYAESYSHHVAHLSYKKRCDQLFNPLYGL